LSRSIDAGRTVAAPNFAVSALLLAAPDHVSANS